MKLLLSFQVLLLSCFCLSTEKSFIIATPAPENQKLEFVYRIPKEYSQNSPIMVLFGGRNWPGAKTLKGYNFDKFADKYGVFLLSPSFMNDNYWEPEKWSGAALKKAISKLEGLYHLKPKKLYFYGYSAGGQCANLFYAWMPEQVEAWATHACGVYFDLPIKNLVSALVSCGSEDMERWQISRQFIYWYRENGGHLIWVPYRNKDHELNQEALEIAKTFFEDMILKHPPQYIGDDDSKIVYPVSEKDKVSEEYRNFITSEKLLECWKAAQ